MNNINTLNMNLDLPKSIFIIHYCLSKRKKMILKRKGMRETCKLFALEDDYRRRERKGQSCKTPAEHRKPCFPCLTIPRSPGNIYPLAKFTRQIGKARLVTSRVRGGGDRIGRLWEAEGVFSIEEKSEVDVSNEPSKVSLNQMNAKIGNRGNSSKE